MNNEDFPALSRNQDSKSSPDRDTTTSSSSSDSTWITTQGILEGFSFPATPGRSNSESYSDGTRYFSHIKARFKAWNRTGALPWVQEQKRSWLFVAVAIS
jgi:hypothetical protein